MAKAHYILRLNRDRLERIVAGCLRSTIEAHGPITLNWADSAAKRISNQLLGEITQHIAREKALHQPEREPEQREGT